MGGCRTDATVNIRADSSGAGVVSVDVVLDADATKGLGDGEGRLVTDDLAENGWALTQPEPTETGGSVLHAEKSFADVGQANAILRELTGTNGALSSLSLTRKRSLTGVKLSLTGTVDLQGGLGSFGDADLKALTGSTSALGIDDGELSRQAGAEVADAFTFAVSGNLIESSKRWDVRLGTRKEIALGASRFTYEPIVGIAAAVGALAGLVLLLASFRKNP